MACCVNEDVKKLLSATMAASQAIGLLNVSASVPQNYVKQ